jgi:NAD(P)-dependent dehydrogenase (short-subunit alcohol dehydrogenase family)
MVGFVRSTAPTLMRHNITFNVICPATVRTGIITADYFEQMAAAGGGVMEPSAIADAVVQAITSGDSGETLVCTPDRPPRKVSFPPLDI